ncbi:MAG: hypothetical protein AAGF93_23015 [Cyanobacteria bacterium P01_H01_bin.105]
MEICIQKIEPNQSLIDQVGRRIGGGYIPVPEVTIPEESRNLEDSANFLVEKDILKSTSNVIYGASFVANYKFRGEDYNTPVFVYGYTEEIDDLDDIVVYVISSSPIAPNDEWHIFLGNIPG